MDCGFHYALTDSPIGGFGGAGSATTACGGDRSCYREIMCRNTSDFQIYWADFFKSEVQERSRRIKKVVHDDNAAVIKGILLVDTLPST